MTEQFKNDWKQNVEIKHVPFRKIFWFSKLNMKIHEKDPIFVKANQSTIERFKFLLNFSFKIILQSRFVLVVGNEIAGALSLEIKKHSLFIYAVGLLEKYRRKGFGTYLMNFAEDLAKRNEKEYVNFSVLLANTAAIKFYEKLGYRSQGLGLTLLRCFIERIFKDLYNVKKVNLGSFIFQKITQSRKIKSLAIKWWIEEIANLNGDEGRYLTEQEKMLDFRAHLDWNAYRIIYENNEVGIVTVLPYELIPTIVLFSDPALTWDFHWTSLLIKNLMENNLITHHKKNNTLISLEKFQLQNASIIQIFLTYQHMENILKVEQNMKFFIHDSLEDRQVYYKKLNQQKSN